MKHILTLCLLLLSTSVLAIPAQRIKKTITLADGTQKQVMLVGDENMHYYLDADNNAYTCDKHGFYVKNDRVKLEKQWKERLTQRNKHRLERAEARGMIINPKSQEEQSFRRRAQWGAEQNPVSGDKRGLVILANFSDKDIYSAHGKEFYNRFFNEVGFSEAGNAGSVHDYFYECSYGQFNLTFDIFGPVTLSKPSVYYGQNDNQGYDMYPGEMVAEACTLIAEMGIDFSKYDWDSDGQVDQVFVVYAGYGEHSDAPADNLWPHECTLTEDAKYGDGKGAVTFNGVTIDTYAIASELDGVSGVTPSGIGLACHEFSHCMCIPDFYDTTQSGLYGMDAWDLMDYGSYSGNNNGNCPAPFTSYERMYCGWLTPKVLDEPCIVSEMKTLTEAPEAYIIYNGANSNEYYMLENRQGEGFDASSPAKGMLVLHVYFDSQVWLSNTVNSSDIQHMTIIPADGVRSSFTNGGDTWPGTKGKTELTDTSSPAAKLYTANVDGKKKMGKPIEEIADSDGKISFIFNGGVAIDIPIVSEATEVKADGFTVCWDAVEDATGYKVKLTAEDIEPQQNSLEEVALVHEDFKKFNNGKTSDGASNLGSALDDYTAMPGWSGDKLYTTPQNEVKMGTAKNYGYISTPWLSAQSEYVTFTLTARKYKTDSDPLMIYVGDDMNNECIGEIKLTDDPARYVFSVSIPDNSFWVELYCAKRCYISEVGVYDGSYSQEELETGIISKKNYRTITLETEQTRYDFTNLSNKCLYTYSVCALNGKGRSKWSNPVEVTLPDNPEGIDHIDVEHSTLNIEHYYTLDGMKLSSPQRGFNIIRKTDGSVKKIIK